MLDPGGRGMHEKKKKNLIKIGRELIDDINILFFSCLTGEAVAKGNYTSLQRDFGLNWTCRSLSSLLFNKERS